MRVLTISDRALLDFLFVNILNLPFVLEMFSEIMSSRPFLSCADIL